MSATLNDLDLSTISCLRGVIHRLRQAGLVASLTHTELEMLAIEPLTSASRSERCDQAFRYVIWHRLEWLIANCTLAYDMYWDLRDEGCCIAAAMQVVRYYEDRYHADEMN